MSIRNIAIGFLTFFLVLVTIDSCATKTNLDTYIEEYKSYRRSAQETVVLAESLKDSVVKLERVAIKEEQVADSLQRLVDRLKRQTPSLGTLQALRDSVAALKTLEDSVKMAREVIPRQEIIIATLDTANAKQDSTIEYQSEQIQSWIRIATTHEERARILAFALDTTVATLNNLPKPPSNPDRWIFGLKKPTRTQSFIGGGIVGGLVVYVVSKELDRGR